MFHMMFFDCFFFKYFTSFNKDNRKEKHFTKIRDKERQAQSAHAHWHNALYSFIETQKKCVKITIIYYNNNTSNKKIKITASIESK